MLSDHTNLHMPVHVLHGKRPGPTVFVSSCIHGDEIIGLEVSRRLLRAAPLKSLKGTLLVVPIVNGFGFINRSRYLPDRRDLNRSFPGRPEGSLASRLAHLFMTQVVERCDVGIDMHSAAIHRTNLPQIRISPEDEKAMELATAFAAPATVRSSLRSGSLRQAAADAGVATLLYEAGEGLRFDEFSARVGVIGILRVLRHLGMVPGKGVGRQKQPSIVCSSSSWMRSPGSGLFRSYVETGQTVAEGETLAVVSGPFGEVEWEAKAPNDGLVIGRAVLPVVNEGDAIFHVASVGDVRVADATIDEVTSEIDDHPLFDEDSIT